MLGERVDAQLTGTPQHVARLARHHRREGGRRENHQEHGEPPHVLELHSYVIIEEVEEKPENGHRG